VTQRAGRRRLTAMLFLAAVQLTACTAPPPPSAPASEATRAPGAELEDALITGAVKAALVAHDPDSTTNVRVAVRDKVVTLTGTVKDRKTRDDLVRVTETVVHVKAVHDGLRVDPRQRRLGEQVDDFALAARIQTAAAAQVGFKHVIVHVDRGVVTLEGSVPDAKTKATVVRTARDTEGVRNVVDRMRVGEP
jgi:osmotically-inducible protein OsmY